MRRIYVCGSYSADNVMDVLHNIGRGIKISTKIFDLGFAPFCPWLDYHFALENQRIDKQAFYEYSISWLKVSEAVYVLSKSQYSVGTQHELDIAKEHKIPIFDNIPALVMWGQND